MKLFEAMVGARAEEAHAALRKRLEEGGDLARDPVFEGYPVELSM